MNALCYIVAVILAAAPDREKLAAFATALSAVSFPKMETADGAILASEIYERLSRLIEWVNAETTKLEGLPENVLSHDAHAQPETAKPNEFTLA